MSGEIIGVWLNPAHILSAGFPPYLTNPMTSNTVYRGL